MLTSFWAGEGLIYLQTRVSGTGKVVVTTRGPVEVIQLEKGMNVAVEGRSVTCRTDGLATIQFGGREATTVNCLPITDGWSYTVRLFRPQADILEGTWKAPLAEPKNWRLTTG